jgi:hypothetical protein
MLTLYYTPGACSMAAHIVLEESGEEYEAKKVDLAYMSANITGKPRAFLPYFEGGASERCLEPSSSIVTFMVRRSLGCDEHCAAIAPPAALTPRFFNDG